MPFHPRSAHWFEAEIPRHQTVYALQALADSGRVQLEEQRHDTAPCANASAVQACLLRFDKLRRRHAADLPEPARPLKQLGQMPEQLADDALERLREWASHLLATRRLAHRKRRELAQLSLLLEGLEAMQAADARELGALAHTTEFLFKKLFACPHEQTGEITPCEGAYSSFYSGDDHDFWLVACNSGKKHLMQSAAALFDCISVDIPPWLPPAPDDQLREVGNRLERLEREHQDLLAELQRLRNDAGVANALAEMRLLRWLLAEHVSQAQDHVACRVNGWTFASTPDELEQLLRDADVQAQVVFSSPHSGLQPPVNFGTARWLRPFRVFVDIVGAPDDKEVDPTPVVGLIVPLLFGFMFPDLGHGVILALAGLLLMRYRREAAILIPCGLGAAGFGLLFGEVFGLQGVLPSPFGTVMEQPLPILAATLVLGVCIVLLGLVFSGIEAYWRGELTRWLWEEAAILVMYFSVALGVIWPHAWYAAMAALAWYLVGTLVLCRGRNGACLGEHVGALLESAFQLGLATLSFLRVGAFALAHAAFSGMAGQLVSQIDSPALQVLVFVLVHLAIIVIEGVVVMIQTTRLVLLEFFMRFLRFGGRIYTPLAAPAEPPSDR